MVNTFLELAGFALLVAAAASVAPGLALLTGGLGLIVIANRPQNVSREESSVREVS